MAPKWTMVGLAGGALLFMAAPVLAQSSDDMQRAAERQQDNSKERAVQEADEPVPEVKQSTEGEETEGGDREGVGGGAVRRRTEHRQGQAGGSAAGRQGQADAAEQQVDKAKQEGQQQVDKAKQTTEQPKPLPAPDPTIPRP